MLPPNYGHDDMDNDPTGMHHRYSHQFHHQHHGSGVRLLTGMEDASYDPDPRVYVLSSFSSSHPPLRSNCSLIPPPGSKHEHEHEHEICVNVPEILSPVPIRVPWPSPVWIPRTLEEVMEEEQEQEPEYKPRPLPEILNILGTEARDGFKDDSKSDSSIDMRDIGHVCALSPVSTGLAQTQRFTVNATTTVPTSATAPTARATA